MKILGIDYGTKRIGIAISDADRKFALPLEVVQNSSKVVAEIQEIATKDEVKEVVIGESKDYKGNPNPSFAGATTLKESLEKIGLVVHWEPEFMTSMHAEKLQGKHDLIDASAAALILQSYLDRQ